MINPHLLLDNADPICEIEIEYIPEAEWYQVDPTIRPSRVSIYITVISVIFWLCFFLAIVWLLI